MIENKGISCLFVHLLIEADSRVMLMGIFCGLFCNPWAQSRIIIFQRHFYSRPSVAQYIKEPWRKALRRQLLFFVRTVAWLTFYPLSFSLFSRVILKCIWHRKYLNPFFLPISRVSFKGWMRFFCSFFPVFKVPNRWAQRLRPRVIT